MQRNLAGECEKNDQRNASYNVGWTALFISNSRASYLFTFRSFQAILLKNVHFGGIQTGIICV